MHTSILLLALWGIGGDSRAALATPQWASDYQEASRLVEARNRPLLILFAHGKDGWDRVVSGGEPTPQVQQLLASDYVCASIDTSTEMGQRLADRFELPDGTGLVISDRAGAKQAFWHAGRISESDLGAKLRKYADPEVRVETTETLVRATTVTTSSYAPAAAQAAYPVLDSTGVAQPVQPAAPAYQPGFAPSNVAAYQPALAPQAPMMYQAPSFTPSFVPAAAGRGC